VCQCLSPSAAPHADETDTLKSVDHSRMLTNEHCYT